MRRSVERWYRRISFKANVPGLYRRGFLSLGAEAVVKQQSQQIFSRTAVYLLHISTCFLVDTNLPSATPLLFRFADLLASAIGLPPTLPPRPPVPPPEGRPRLLAPVAVLVRRAVCFRPAIEKD